MNGISKELDRAASEYAEETFRLRQSRDEDFPEASYYYEAFIKGFEFAKDYLK